MAKFRGVVTAAAGALLIGGVKTHRSSWFDTEREASYWLHAVREGNDRAGRQMASAEIERRDADGSVRVFVDATAGARVKTPAQLEREIAASRSRSDPEGFVSLPSWQGVLEHVANGGQLWYRAPMDLHPRSILVVKVFKNGKLRIDPMSRDADRFSADAGHLNRFYRRS